MSNHHKYEENLNGFAKWADSIYTCLLTYITDCVCTLQTVCVHSCEMVSGFILTCVHYHCLVHRKIRHMYFVCLQRQIPVLVDSVPLQTTNVCQQPPYVSDDGYFNIIVENLKKSLLKGCDRKIRRRTVPFCEAWELVPNPMLYGIQIAAPVSWSGRHTRSALSL